MTLSEDDLIAHVFAPLATAAGADALGDDAATFPGGSGDVVVTVDALAEGVHFFRDDPPGAVAAKALRVNLSDLAAKGAEPFGYVVALALGGGCTAEWAQAFADGLARDNARYGVALLGGDTLRGSPGGGTTISITAFGRADAGGIVRRRTARPGDLLVVTGTIGDSALGLAARLDSAVGAALPEGTAAALDAAYLWPDPPVTAWPAVRAHARAAMDISDGLHGDLVKMCRTAGVSATLDAGSVPLSAAVRAAVGVLPHAFDRVLTGGDDYQILAAVGPESVGATAARSSARVSHQPSSAVSTAVRPGSGSSGTARKSPFRTGASSISELPVAGC